MNDVLRDYSMIEAPSFEAAGRKIRPIHLLGRRRDNGELEQLTAHLQWDEELSADRPGVKEFMADCAPGDKWS